MKKSVTFSVILIGFTAMAAQIVLMRELLVVFHGNEISMGFILAGWLIWGSFGSGLLGRFATKVKSKTYAFSLCEFALAVLLPLSILAIRSLKDILNFGPGEMIGFLPMALSSLIILAPTCSLLGLMFSLACRLYERPLKSPATKIGTVYILEAIGSLIGGLLISFLFIRLFQPFEIMGILSLINIIAALVLLASSQEARNKPLSTAIFILSLIAIIFVWFLGGWLGLEQYSLKKQWRGYELLTAKNSIYGNIVVTKSSGQISFFNNGLHLYTIPDRLNAEQAVHFALLEHPYPQEVLIVGAGIGGLVEEALKHPLKSVDYVELDPLIINLAKAYLDKSAYSPTEDPRVLIKNLDGRFFIKTANRQYDCVIVHLGDPFTAQLNRFYTIEFFQEVKRVLKEGGVLSFALTSSENYLSPEQKDFLGSIYLSLKSSFGDVKVIPGDTAYFLASDKTGTLTYDYKVLMQRVQDRGLDLKYVREYYLFSNLSRERIAYLENSLGLNKRAKVNSDFRPISYYYGVVLWSTYFRNSFLTKVLVTVTGERIWKIILVLGVAVLLFYLFRRKTVQPRKVVLLAVAATGFTEIALQVTILLSFQIIYGYLFYKLGIILTCFMLGLALGGWWMITIMPGLKKDIQVFIYMQLGLGIYALTLPLVFWWLAGARQMNNIWIGANIVFILLPIIAGFIGGMQFPLANKIYLEKKENIGQAGGLVYGVDLLGSCLGALSSGIFFIPLLGIPVTCSVLAAINFMVWSCLVLFQRTPARRSRNLCL